MLCFLPTKPKQSTLKMPPFLQSFSHIPPTNMSNLSLFPFFVLILLLTFSAGASAVSLRRFLHQPLFFPLDSFPPSASPQPQPQLQPKQPFSFSSTPQTQVPPFFPSYSASPPPPSPSSYLVTFPANISSLLIPTSPSPSSSHHRLTAAVVSVTLLSVALLFAISALILLRYRRANVGGFSDDKSSHFDGLRLVPSNISSSDAVPTSSAGRPPCYASASSSSEFLDRGTLSTAANPYVDAASEAVASADTSTSRLRSHQKLGSPELRPLPPLPRVPTNLSDETASFSINNDEARKEECYQDDNDGEDQFFSPRGSSSQRDVTNSPDFRRAAMNPQRESEFLSQYRNLGLNLRNPFYPYNVVSGSSRNSALSDDGNVASLLMDSSRLSQKSSSPEAVLKFLDPTHVSGWRAMPVNSPTLSSLSSSPVSDTNPHMLKTSVETPPIVYPTRNPPPLPPPVPHPRFWENPIFQDPSTGQPVLMVPSRPVMSSTPPPEQELQRSGSGGEGESSGETTRPKLKALHWDKVRASADRAMVWDQIKSSSFQLNEEMIETLFVVNSLAQKENARQSVLPSLLNHENRVLDPKKSQNIAILLKALNVTIEEVCESLMEGNVDSMGSELLESLLKMAPTNEEEQKLKEFKDESPVKLGPAEKFLKALLDVPFAFKRVDAMLYITNFDSETEYLGRSFETLKAACGELKNSKLFLKLLEAVLKTGNRMNVGTNRGDARAFKLDTLLKLVDIKGKDGKTTLLHFVVQEIVRIEGSELSKDNNKTNNQSSLEFDFESRKLGLQVVSGLSGELTNVKKAATMDSCILSNEVAKLAGGLIRVNDIIKMCCNERNKDVPPSKFAESMKRFVSRAEQEIVSVQAEENATRTLVRELTEYFHGNSGKEEAHPFRIFLIVKDFVDILDRVCKEVGRINERSIYGLAVQFSAPSVPSVPSFFTEFSERREFAASQADGCNDR